jgi:hypothetical protein
MQAIVCKCGASCWAPENPDRNFYCATCGALLARALVRPRPVRKGMARHIRIVSVLLIIHAALLLILGVVFLGMAAMIEAEFRSMARRVDTPEVLWIGMGGAGVGVLTVAVIQLVAGIKGLRVRGRALGLVALFSNLMILSTCYCLPTGLGLMIYGLIVYYSSSATRAFAAVEAGVPWPEALKL